MKVVNRMILAVTLLCFLTGCNDKEVNNIEPIDIVVEDDQSVDNSSNEDILDNKEEYDISSIDNQIKTIVF